MPAHPPQKATDRSEIEELVHVGYEAECIHGVEENEQIARDLYDYHGGLCQIHGGTVEEYLLYSKCRFSYIHLDFCEQLRKPMVESITACRNRLDLIARIRTSVSYTRRAPAQMRYEQSIRDNVMVPFIHAANEADTGNEERWIPIEENLEKNTESTQIVGFLMLFDHFFGIDYREWADSYLMEDGPGGDGDGFPYPEGTHVLHNIQRFHYREDTGTTQMGTIWADFFPLQIHLIPNQEWVLNYVYNYMLQLTAPEDPFIIEIQMESD